MNLVLDIRTLRRSYGLRQKDLAAKVGITVHELMKLERGLEKVDDTVWLKLCDALGMDGSSRATLSKLFLSEKSLRFERARFSGALSKAGESACEHFELRAGCLPPAFARSTLAWSTLERTLQS